MSTPIQLTDVDRRIWHEELDQFVPRKVFDVHTHIYRWAFNTDPNKESGPYAAFVGQRFREAGRNLLNACDEILMPGREVHRLSFPFPFAPSCDFAASNDFLAEEICHDRKSGGLMLVKPSMTATELEQQVDRHGFLGFKPY